MLALALSFFSLSFASSHRCLDMKSFAMIGRIDELKGESILFAM